MARFEPRICSGQNDEALGKTCRVCLARIKQGDEVVKLYRGRYRHLQCKPPKKTNEPKMPADLPHDYSHGGRVIRKGETFS